MLRDEREPDNFPSLIQWLNLQNEAQPRHRALLIDWLFCVRNQYNLQSNTIFITVNLIDRVMMRQRVSLEELQLVGVTSMLIASKYQEIYPPKLQDFVDCTAQAFTPNQLR